MFKDTSVAAQMEKSWRRLRLPTMGPDRGGKPRGDMLKGIGAKHWFWIASGLILIALPLLVMSAQSYQGCLQEKNRGPAFGQSAVATAQVENTFARRRWCVGIFLEQSSGAVTALATVVLTISTIGLWWWTRNSVQISRRMLTELERPYLYIFGAYKLECTTDGAMPFVRYTVANYGRLPGEVLSIQGGLAVGGKEPPDDILKDASTAWRMREPVYELGAQRQFKASIDHPFTAYQNSDEIVPVLQKGERLYLKVVVRYIGPFGDIYETSACWVHLKRNNRFVKYGGLRLNKVA